MSKQEIVVCMVHYGERAVTRSCLKSLWQYEKDIPVVLVDNTGTLTKKDLPNHPFLTLLTNRTNTGFASAINRAITYALNNNAAYVLLLNNDTIIQHSFIRKLKDSMGHKPRLGIVSPAICSIKENNTTYDLGGYIHSVYGKTYHKQESLITQHDILFPDYVSGCCMLIKKEVLTKIGLFDTDFFLYYEDVDFCLRARKEGFLVGVDPSVWVLHKLSASIGKLTKEAVYYQTLSAKIFGKKYRQSILPKVSHLLFLFLQTLLFTTKNPFTSWYAWQAFFQKDKKAMLQYKNT